MIESEEILNLIKSLWQKFDLDNNQKLVLSDEVDLYLSGTTKKRGFAPNLMYFLGVTKEQADQIKQEIDEKIVSRVKNSFDLMQSNVTKDDVKAYADETRTGDMSSAQYDNDTSDQENTVPQPQDYKKDREEILRTIETPSSSMNPTAIDEEGMDLDERLDSIVKIGKNQDQTPNNIPLPRQVPQTPNSTRVTMPPQNNTYKDDPYREPTE